MTCTGLSTSMSRQNLKTYILLALKHGNPPASTFGMSPSASSRSSMTFCFRSYSSSPLHSGTSDCPNKGHIIRPATWHLSSLNCQKDRSNSKRCSVRTPLCTRHLSTAQIPAPTQPKTEHTQPYHPPTSGLLSYLPPSWVPYAELARLDKPAGSYYLFFPCLFSTLLAGGYAAAAPATVTCTTGLFAAGALVMRGAGCTINDLWDRNLDPQVTRTRLRPLARKAITPVSALLFAGVQSLVGLGVLVQFPSECLYWGVPSLLLVGTYPLAKRVTHYPQFVLGLTFSWGAFMGFPALGVDVLIDNAAKAATGLLYASCVSWTVLYDMIYAHMDLKDDKIAGIKSIALKHEHETKQVLSGLAAFQVALLAGAGASVGAGPAFFVGSCGGAIVTLGIMIRKVKLKDANDCWWWFKYGSWLTGGVISLGLLAEYIEKRPRTLRPIESRRQMQEDIKDT